MGAILELYVLLPADQRLVLEFDFAAVAAAIHDDVNRITPSMKFTAEQVTEVLSNRFRNDSAPLAAFAIMAWIRRVGQFAESISINSHAVSEFESALEQLGLDALINNESLHANVRPQRPRCGLIRNSDLQRLLIAAELAQLPGAAPEVLHAASRAITDAITDALEAEGDLLTVWA